MFRFVTKSVVGKGKLRGWIMDTKNLERYRNNFHKNDIKFRDFKRYKSLETSFIYTMILHEYTGMGDEINDI